MHQEFAIARTSLNRRSHEIANSNSVIDAPPCESTEHPPVNNRVANYSFLPDLPPAGFKLGLYQDHRRATGSQVLKGWRQDEFQGDKRHVRYYKIHLLMQIQAISHVHPFHAGHSRILLKSGVKLAMANVDRVYAAGAVLQKAVSEPASRGANVE